MLLMLFCLLTPTPMTMDPRFLAWLPVYMDPWCPRVALPYLPRTEEHRDATEGGQRMRQQREREREREKAARERAREHK